MARYCKIIVLPEDAEHAALARGFFNGRNVNERTYQIDRWWHGKNGNNAAVREWFCKEIKEQAKPTGARFGILALIDEDGKGVDTLRSQINDKLNSVSLPTINPMQGRCLVIPVRNVETWLIWAARWQAVGLPSSPTPPATYPLVSESNDYKRFKEPNGNPISKEPLAKAYDTGKIIAQLNPVSPPAGTPPALQAVLEPLRDFLNWAAID